MILCLLKRNTISKNSAFRPGSKLAHHPHARYLRISGDAADADGMEAPDNLITALRGVDYCCSEMALVARRESWRYLPMTMSL